MALCIVGRDGRLLAVNDLHSELAGRPIDSLIDVKVADLHEEGGCNIKRDFRVFDAGGTVPNHELEIRGKNYMVSVSPIHDAGGQVIAISVAHFDISEKKAMERKIERTNRRLQALSKLDHLTGLENRRQFDTALNARCTALLKNGDEFSLIVLDVDYFKHYNDLYGHQAGDRCLKDVASCVRRSLRRNEAAAYRYGGEEFTVLTFQPDPAVAAIIAERICESVRRRAVAHERSPHLIVTVSCGVASTLQLNRPIARTIAQDLISAADAALYLAKADGRNAVRPFNPLQSAHQKSRLLG